ncbi:MAG: DUF305 domain-containing protein [Rhizobiales bacterium]|nr:DUF305 domain-containing protein [Hyphomicrobiales bacterium]MBN9009127.1 DUF305 domain-containing protein [Hyphomicrobiales bacterium]
MTTRRNALFVLVAMLPVAAYAAEMSHDMSQMGGMAMGDEEAVKAFEAANEKMMQGMHGMAMTGDVDKDFVTMMIPHHQGAIDMAEVVLKYGRDPQIKALAEAIVRAQETEIAEMKAWLARH